MAHPLSLRGIRFTQVIAGLALIIVSLTMMPRAAEVSDRAGTLAG
jgi:hypothetical protein